MQEVKSTSDQKCSFFSCFSLAGISFSIPVATRRRFNVYKTFERRRLSTGIEVFDELPSRLP